MHIAIIGAGVSGLSAAYALRQHARITLFEKSNYVGGHANTVEVTEGERTIGIDTAFVVCNARTYPQLLDFFSQLGVGLKDHIGGFTFFDRDSGLEYGTAELELDHASLRERYPEEFCGLIGEAQRFFATAPKDFLRGRTNMSLGAYLDQNGYSEAFKMGYVILLATAVWSIPAEKIWEMPASTLIAFFMSHDQGGLGGSKVPWKTVDGGSISYVRKALAAIQPELYTSCAVVGVREGTDRVYVKTADGGEQRFDYAVIATHADHALSLIGTPSGPQELLSAVQYNSCDVVLHTDPSVMPASRNRWLSWNYGKVSDGGHTRCYVAYYMNPLQSLDAEKQYFVTLDYPGPIDPGSIIREFRYTHPIIDVNVRNIQRSLYSINDHGRIKFCGSYFHSKKIGPDLIGSHEAGFASGIEAARSILRTSAQAQHA